MRGARLLVGLASVLGVGVTIASSATAHAWCRMTTSSRSPSPGEPCILPDPTAEPPEQFLEWLEPCSALTLSAAAPSDDLTEDEVRGVFARSIATWESVQCDGMALGIDIELIDDRSTCVEPLYRDDGGNVNTVMFVADWGDRMYDPAAFAVTTVWHRRSTGEILDVDMEVNERRGPFGICPPEGCLDDRVVDLENVVTHELGHYLGLAHSTDPAATMFASAVAGETVKRDLSSDDADGICEVYPAGRPAGECDYAPRGGLVLHCEEGCSVAAPGTGRATGFAFVVALAGLFAFRRRRRA